MTKQQFESELKKLEDAIFTYSETIRPVGANVSTGNVFDYTRCQMAINGLKEAKRLLESNIFAFEVTDYG